MCIPFAAGVALGALLQLPSEGALAGSLTCAAAISALALTRGRGLHLCAILFFALGTLCWCTEALTGGIAFSLPQTLSFLSDGAAAAISDAGFPGPHSEAIVTALLTGRRSWLDAETVRVFRESGAAHILALSGLHLGIIYLILSKLLSPAGNSRAARIVCSAVIIAACGIYAAATGARPSIIRAFLYIVIRETGRHTPARRTEAFGIALTVQLCLSPHLITSPGFQLSYLAMLGVTLLFPVMQDWYPQTREFQPLRRIWTAASLSISCQLFTAPALLWHFGSLPQHFLLANLIALPLAEAAIVVALATLLLGAVGINTKIPAALCGRLVQALEFCLQTIASM